ncbi:MAG TPA: hypothetical protein VHS06_11030 [Chloroflexota bacterium]|nr:hypothetical protein [Chloroflexota bacterium]
MEQTEILRYVVEVLEKLQVPYMLVGSISSAVYGEPRMTLDIDVVVQLVPDEIEHLCEAFPPEEYYVSQEAALDALAHEGQFNVIHASSGNKVDFMVARSDAWGVEQLCRRVRLELLPGLHGYVASPEDVIIGKMLYYRDGGSEKHLRDIVGILKTGPQEVDKDYVRKWAGVLGLSDIWEITVARL